MDPDRVRSYLQVACAGLGFDIGEVWWMSNESGTSTVAQIEERNSSPEPSRGGGDSGRGGGSPPIIECPDGAVGHLDVSSVSGSAIGSNGASGGHAAVGGAKKRGPRKRFLQLYTSKAYCNQRSKLVQPHEMEDSDSDENDDNDKNDGENDNGGNGNNNGNELLPGQRKSPLFDRDASSSTSNSSSTSLTVRRHHNHNKNSHSPPHSHANSHSALLDEDEHVLSPRIVEAVTLSAQVVWANCQKQEGLLGRSDIKLQTAIGMPVGVDETGNVWVVVMFSPKNVESSSDAIDYLQYISRSAASSSIPCLLPVIRQEGRGEGRGGQAGPKMICDGSAAVKSEEGEESVEEEHHRKHNNHLNDNHNHNHHLVSIQPKVKPTDHTQELGDGVIAQFVSFRLTDDDENDTSLAAGMGAGSTAFDLDMSDNDLRNAPKDDFGIPMLPDMQQPQQIVLNDALTEAFDEASYGVWSTIMNSAGGDAIRTSGAIASKMHLIQERLEEFAMAFLGMSMFDVADAWITSIAGVVAENGTVNANAVDLGDGIVVCNEAPKLKCLFTVAAENMQNDNVHVFREVSASASIDIGDGAVGKAFSTGYPVWSSDKSIIYDKRRKNSLQNCKIESIFAVPIFSAGDVAPSCVLSCYSLVPVESVPFVLNFVQKAVRLLWDGLDKVKPHESVGKDLWKDVGPADLGEMAADLEMQKAFFGKKRTYSDLSATGQSTSVDNHKHNRPNPSSAQTGLTYLLADNEDSNSTSRDRSSSYATQVKALSSVVPTSLFQLAPINAPPAKGLGPAPTFPTSVQRASSAQSFVLFNPQNNQGFQTIQQAVRSVGNVAEWHNSSGNNAQVNQYSTHIVAPPQAQQPNAQSSNSSQQSQFQPEYQYQMDENHNFFLSYANYGGSTVPTTWIEPTSQQNTTHSPSPPLSINPPPPQALSQPPGAAYHHGNNNSHPLEPPGTFAEDPAAARANIVEFNAMAQMHSTPAVPDNIAQYSTGYSRYENGTGDGTKDIPISQGNGSFVVTEQPQQSNGYTTPTAEHATQNSYGMSTDQSPQSVYCMTTGQPPQNIQFMPTAQPVVSIDPLNTSYNSSAEKICRIEGCNDVAHSKRPYCFRHCGNRQCEKEGCNKCAQGATRFCIAHGGGRRCTFPGCDKGARDKYFCAAHGGGKRCKHNGCNKSAVGGSSYCTSHGGGRRCQVEGCDKSAQSSTSFCVKHGGGKKCHHEGCEKVARGRTLYCAAHGGGIRCKLEGCNRVAIGKAQLCRTHGGGSNRMKAGVQQPMYPPLHNM